MTKNSENIDDNQLCDYCQTDSEILYTRQGFIQTFFIEWVCGACYKNLTGVEFNVLPEATHEL